ncbi:MAG: fumarylacetoacetate hydrolase family protein, partial [Armatimonadota bacterium]|nr:fumarylacetoacetate hydrolase family protein [Armatimonadota bacterium]
EPGDILATGTPEGVGMGFSPPRWLQPGDVMEAEVEGIGVLRNQVVAPR